MTPTTPHMHYFLYATAGIGAFAAILAAGNGAIPDSAAFTTIGAAFFLIAAARVIHLLSNIAQSLTKTDKSASPGTIPEPAPREPVEA